MVDLSIVNHSYVNVYQGVSQLVTVRTHHTVGSQWPPQGSDPKLSSLYLWPQGGRLPGQWRIPTPHAGCRGWNDINVGPFTVRGGLIWGKSILRMTNIYAPPSSLDRLQGIVCIVTFKGWVFTWVVSTWWCRIHWTPCWFHCEIWPTNLMHSSIDTPYDEDLFSLTQPNLVSPKTEHA